jgi:hypothetical protein
MCSPGRSEDSRGLARGFLLLLGCLLAFSAAGRAGAQEAPPDSAEDEETTGPKISIHGYLSQAYAQSNGFQIVGITEDGTMDYRTAALQVRADITDKDAFVIQLSHERLGESPVTELKQDVELDWIFYQRVFGESAVKVGRVQIPLGIYNEVRDVGTILPFFRPSLDFYGEGTFNTETVDGIVLSHTFDPWGAWTLEGDLYYGGFEFFATDSEYFRGEAKELHGFELWLQTPLPGLRIGAGVMRFDFHDTRQPADLDVPWTVYHVALTAAFGRFIANAESAYWDEGPWIFETFYLHLGYLLTDRITLNGQVELSEFMIEDFFDGDFNREKTLGVNYAFRPDLVLKAEHHWNTGYYSENPLPDLSKPPLDIRFWILSLSTSF